MSMIRRIIRSDKPPGQPSKLWLMSESAPYEVPICAYFFLLAAGNLLSGLGVTPTSVDDTYPLWLIIPWCLSTLIGAGLSLVGRYVEAFRMESVGQAFIFVACGIYIGAVLGINGFNAFYAALAYVAIATGCVIRMRVIYRSHKAQKFATEVLQSEQGDVT